MVHAVQNQKKIDMNTILKKIVWVIMLLPAVYLAIIWNKLPESIAMQYNLKGEPIRFSSLGIPSSQNAFSSEAKTKTWPSKK